ncbi:MAG: Mur ligase family protein, partial [Leptospiraceae bacterium]|nr:Mur ligase family protein [Leptospiraceae bacterium]
VAGSHGKTTTTAMIASILFYSGFDPAIMVGGDMVALGDKGGYFGKGEWGVYESDESDGTFLNHASEIQVLTNIDNDHLDYYKTIENLHDSFYKFLNLSATSKRIVFLDDDGIQSVVKKFPHLENFFCITSNPENKGKNYIQYFIENGKLFFTKDSQKFELVTPYQGKHYLTNALCATLACLEVGIPISKSLEILRTYKGVRRRLEYLGAWKNVKVYDDYGHHPTEIEAVLSSLNSMKTKTSQKVLVLFQPHRYTRTKEHYLDFAKVLSKSDFCCLLPIYSAGELPIEGVSSELIYKYLTNKEKSFLLSGEKEKDIPKLQSLLNQDDLLVCLGAGNVREWGELLIQSHTLSFSDK